MIGKRSEANVSEYEEQKILMVWEDSDVMSDF